MVGKNIKECKKNLGELDNHTLEARARRRLELPGITTDGRQDFSQQQWDYSSAASENYISGRYRNAIFCSAASIDQIFRYEYIKGAKNKGRAIKYLNKRITFGQLIRQVENQIKSFGNLTRLTPFIEKADLLNQIRNKVAVHPLFVDLPPKEQGYRALKDYWLAKNITDLINLMEKLYPGSRKEILNKRLETEKTKFKFGEILRKKFNIGKTYISSEVFCCIIQEDLLRLLSLKSIYLMKEILEGLYPVDT